MRSLDIAKTFHDAALDFSAKAKDSGADIIGRAHAIYFQSGRMSPSQLALEIEHLRENLLAINSAFTRLDFAHAAMTVGETASRIRTAASSKPVLEVLEAGFAARADQAE